MADTLLDLAIDKLPERLDADIDDVENFFLSEENIKKLQQATEEAAAALFMGEELGGKKKSWQDWTVPMNRVCSVALQKEIASLTVALISPRTKSYARIVAAINMLNGITDIMREEGGIEDE